MIRIDNLATGVNMRHYRKAAGYSVEQVCQRLDIGRQTTVYEWESGKQLPSLIHMVELAHIYNTTIDDILVKSEDIAVLKHLSAQLPHIMQNILAYIKYNYRLPNRYTRT